MAVDPYTNIGAGNRWNNNTSIPQILFIKDGVAFDPKFSDFTD